MAELTTQTVAPTLPRAQNRVLKKFLGNKSAVIGALVVGFLSWWRCWRRGSPLRPGQSQLPGGAQSAVGDVLVRHRRAGA